MKINHTFIATYALLSIMAPTAYADNLLSVYQLAVQNDSQFKASQAEFRALAESKNQSRALLLPNISASAHYSDNTTETEPTSVSPKYHYKSNGYNLNLTQPIYQHANVVGLTQADAQVAQALANFENAKQDLIVRVASQYFSVLAAKDTLAFAKKEQKAIHEQRIQTQQRFNVGLIAITDVHEARALHDQAIANTIVAENTLAISLETLREITATKHQNLSPLSSDHPLMIPKPANVGQWVNTAETQNPSLMASIKNVEVARTEISRQQSGHYPSLDLNVKHSYTDYDKNAPSLGERQQYDTTVSLQLNIPLYQGGMVNSKTRAAAYRLEQSKQLLEQQKRAIKRQTRNSYLSVVANISQVKALKQALASSQIALEATQAGFDVGTRTIIDVFNSQRELFRAKRDYAQVRYNYVLETLKLKQAAGTLSMLDIEQLNPWFK